MPSTFRLIRRLARDLKYLPLELLWNYPVTIHSVATLEQDIRHELGKIIPPHCPLLTPPETVYGTLEKYQCLDLTAQVPAPLLLQSSYQSGIALLRQLLPEPAKGEDVELEPTRDDDELDLLQFSTLFLERLVEDLDADITVCRIWLESRSRQPLKAQFDARRNNPLSPGLADDYFPHHFIIRDACLTNAKGVWLFKHFYL